MAARRGREATPRSRRLILLAGLNLVAATVLVGLLLRRGRAEAAERGAGADQGAEPVTTAQREGQPSGTAFAAEAKGAATTAASDAPAQLGPDPDLLRRARSAISAARAQARKATQGKVGGAETTIAFRVVDLSSGAVLVDLADDVPLRPASSFKLLSTLSALLLLGPDGHLETAFELTEQGDLVVRAGGDPLFRDGLDGALDPWLDDLASQLSAAGVEAIPGALILDEGDFLEPGPGPAWPSKDQYWAEWCALSGGFSANGGCFTAVVTPTRAGKPARVSLEPRDGGLIRRIDVKTGPRKGPNDVRVGATQRAVTVAGSLPEGAPPFTTRFSHPDPVELFGNALLGGLARRSIPIAGGMRRERGARGGRRVALLRSPITDLLAPILRDSRNSVADQLLFATAHQLGLGGDRQGARQAVERALESLSVDTHGLVVVDGSGLSRDDRVTAAMHTAALVALHQSPAWKLCRDSLAVAGESGTLAGRMREEPTRGRVRAKTGFIGGTSALVGVATTLEGRELVFALLVNYPVFGGLNTSCWKPLGDRLARLLVTYEAPR